MKDEYMKMTIVERLDELKDKKENATKDTRLWHNLEMIESLIKLNKKLYFELFGLYEMRKKNEEN